MVYTKITRTTNGRKAIEYAKGNGKGHNGKKDRNECISTVNMLDGIDPEIQMQKYWLRASKNHMVQMIGVIQSFSRNEFDPMNESDILTVNTIGVEYTEKYFPGRQCMIFTQTDGKSGLLHNHILINDVHMETNKGCDKKQYFWPQLTKWTDEITSKYTDLDFGEKNNNKMSQTERAKRELGKYVWKDDIKERVKKSIEEATSKEDFLERLEANGLGFREGKSKNHGKYFTYELKDLSKVPEGEKLPNRKLKARSFKLGEDFGPEALEIKLASKDKNKEKEKSDAKQFAAETLKRVKEKIKKEEEQAERQSEEERKHAEKLEANEEVEDIIVEEFKDDIDYSKPIKKNNRLLKESHYKIESNQKVIREEVNRMKYGTKNYRRTKELQARANELMKKIEQRQNDGIELY